MTKDEWYAQLFERLGNSKFRNSFHLKEKDKQYVREKGLETIRQHATATCCRECSLCDMIEAVLNTKDKA